MPLKYLFRCAYVAETDEQAYEEIAPYLPTAHSWGEGKYDWIPKIGYYDTEDTKTPQPGNVMFRGTKTGIDFWLENNIAYVGSPETVIRRIKELQKLTGFDIFGARFRFGPMPDEMVRNSIRLFGEKVIPAFADVAVPGSLVTSD